MVITENLFPKKGEIGLLEAVVRFGFGDSIVDKVDVHINEIIPHLFYENGQNENVFIDTYGMNGAREAHELIALTIDREYREVSEDLKREGKVEFYQSLRDSNLTLVGCMNARHGNLLDVLDISPADYLSITIVAPIFISLLGIDVGNNEIRQIHTNSVADAISSISAEGLFFQIKYDDPNVYLQRCFDIHAMMFEHVNGIETKGLHTHLEIPLLTGVDFVKFFHDNPNFLTKEFVEKFDRLLEGAMLLHSGRIEAPMAALQSYYSKGILRRLCDYYEVSEDDLPKTMMAVLDKIGFCKGKILEHFRKETSFALRRF